MSLGGVCKCYQCRVIFDHPLTFVFVFVFFRKYIHRVICQSGVAVTESFFQVEPEEKARKLARFFGYTGDSDQGVLGK